MNIAFCHNSFHLGGAERITLDIIQYLSTFGGQYNLFLFAPEFSKQNFPSEVLEKFTWCQTRHKSKQKSEDVPAVQEDTIEIVEIDKKEKKEKVKSEKIKKEVKQKQAKKTK